MSRTRSTFAPLVAVLAGLAIVACDRSLPPEVTAPTAPRYLAAATEAVTTSVWASQVQGVTESGALYAMFLPHDWNGRLVIFVHGLVNPASPIALPTLGMAAESTLAVNGNAL